MILLRAEASSLSSSRNRLSCSRFLRMRASILSSLCLVQRTRSLSLLVFCLSDTVWYASSVGYAFASDSARTVWCTEAVVRGAPKLI